MQINVDKESLLRSVNIADSIVSKNINTVLSNCLFNISKSQIEIISTDNEIAIRTKIDAVSDSSLSFTANGKKLSSILKELPDDELVIDINDSFLIDLKTKSKDVKGHYTIIGSSSEEYPEVPAFVDENSIEIEQHLLKEMIRKVIYAASYDTIKPVFNGLFFSSDNQGKISIVATDSRRLAIITRSFEKNIDIGDGIIIPLKTMNEIYRLLESTGKCKFTLQKNQCFFRIGNTEIISRIVDGQFPNYRQVIPHDTIFEALVDTKKFLGSVRRAMIFTREPSNKIVLNFSKDKILIEANTPELGKAEEEIPIDSEKAEKISIGINAQFLIDSLKEIDTANMKCGITGQMSPVTILPEDDSNYISVIMPIQIKSS
ncbi:MAG: DNA polymerase III subunit beta [Spirochaetes bacterium]|jgi:DNA polymerase-3 subunit beta|nr:DNA polymerase III subunit beta [Spirochaetota bacterium]